MAAQNLTIFVAPQNLLAELDRYICLIGDSNEEDSKFVTSSSLVELSSLLKGHDLDWLYVENALLQYGIFTIG